MTVPTPPRPAPLPAPAPGAALAPARFRTPASAPRAARAALTGALAVGAIGLIDRAAYHTLLFPRASDYWLDAALKSLGTMYPWLALTVVMTAAALPRLRRGPGGLVPLKAPGLLLASSAAAGALAELLKLVFRRERPLLHDGWHVSRSIFSERPLHSGGLDLPSSHAAVAFGAAFALCVIAPRLRPLWLALAAGCALTRVLAGAHFVSAVVLGAIVAGACNVFICRIGALAEPRVPSDARHVRHGLRGLFGDGA